MLESILVLSLVLGPRGERVHTVPVSLASEVLSDVGVLICEFGRRTSVAPEVFVGLLARRIIPFEHHLVLRLAVVAAFVVRHGVRIRTEQAVSRRQAKDAALQEKETWAG